jgi:hypothetical protein
MNKYKKNYIISSHKYFELFGSYDLNGLKEIYDSKIHLIDWNGEWLGSKSVLEMNENLFKATPIITVLEIIQSDKEINDIQRTYCKIQIEINGVTLKVMDVIDWNNNHQIIKIEAFNG